MKLRLVVALVVLSLPRAGPGGMPVFPQPPSPEAYGRVVLGALAAREGVPPVAFDHWRHRAMYSCRPCHVDAGFAMEANGSGITRSSNASRMHCGACHDGVKTYEGQAIFPACSPYGSFKPEPCGRCHTSAAGPSRREYDAFTGKLPLYAGRYVDWEVAEARGLVKPLDFVEGLSTRRDVMKIDADVPLRAKGTWLGDVTFSHSKHAVWSGCEGCHPEIFPSTRRGAAKIDMEAIKVGKYCGVCHGKVAFPVAQCQKCHETGMQGRGPRQPVRF